MGGQRQRKANFVSNMIRLRLNLLCTSNMNSDHCPLLCTSNMTTPFSRHMRHNDLWDVVHRLVYCPIAKARNKP